MPGIPFTITITRQGNQLYVDISPTFHVKQDPAPGADLAIVTFQNDTSPPVPVTITFLPGNSPDVSPFTVDGFNVLENGQANPQWKDWVTAQDYTYTASATTASGTNIQPATADIDIKVAT